MAIAVDATSTGNQNSGTSCTNAHTCTGSNLILVVGVESFNSGDIITGVTYNGVALTQAVKRAATADTNFVDYIYYLVAPATGTNNIVVSASGTATIRVRSVSYTGAKQTGQPDSTVNSSPATATTAAQAFTTVADNSWTIALVRQFAGGGTLTAGTGSTIRAQDTTNDPGVKLFDSNGAITPAGSYTMNFNYGVSTAWNVVGISIAPDVPTVNTTNFFLMM